MLLHRSSRVIEVFLLAASAAFFLLLGEYAKSNAISNLDLIVFRSVNGLSGNSLLDFGFLALTQLGTTVAWVAITILLTVYYKEGRKRLAVLLIVTLIASELLVSTLKPSYQRSRPLEILNGVILPAGSSSGFSYPSGHALRSFAGSLMLLHLRKSVSYPLIAISGAVAISRIYLGLHYPSDVIGSLLLALALTQSIVLAERYFTRSGAGAGFVPR